MPSGKYIRTDEARANISAAEMGNTRTLGYHHTEETKTKISIANKGKKRSSEICAEMSASQMGRVQSPETCAKISATLWKGGWYENKRKVVLKRRGLGFVPLNERFPGSIAHHVDNEQVIFIPKELHRSIYHSLKTGKNMAQINAEAYNFLFKQEIEVLMFKTIL